jgi:hypothetical protein
MFAVLPAFRSVYEEIAYDYADIVSTDVRDAYVSSPENALSIEELRAYCEQHELLTPWKRRPAVLPLPQAVARRAA